MGPQESEQEKGTKMGAVWPKTSIASENNSDSNRTKILMKLIHQAFKNALTMEVH